MILATLVLETMQGTEGTYRAGQTSPSSLVETVRTLF